MSLCAALKRGGDGAPTTFCIDMSVVSLTVFRESQQFKETASKQLHALARSFKVGRRLF